MSFSLSITVMNAAFEDQRRLNVENLIRRLNPEWIGKLCTDFQIIQDWRKEGPWPTARRCWDHGLVQDSTHHLILQDDIEVCDDFLLGIHEAIRAYDNSPISFYASRKICEEARDKDARWVKIPDGTWGPAILLPKKMISDFLEWEVNHIKPDFKHDDTRLAMWCVETGNDVMCPMPSFVQYMAAQKSLLGQSHPSKVARWYDGKSPLTRDWVSGEVLVGQKGLAQSYYDYYIA